VSRILRFVVSALLLGFLAWRTDWQQIGATFAHLHAAWWLAAVALLAITQVVSSLRWRLLAGYLGLQRPLSRMIGFFYIGMYFNLLLPTSVGGDVVRAWYLDGGSGKRMQAFVSVFLDRLSGLWVLMAVACLGVLFCPPDTPGWIRWSVCACVGCAVLGLAAMPVLTHFRDKLPNKIRKAVEALQAMPSWRAWLAPLGLSVYIQVASVTLVWLVAQSIGAEVPFTYFWILVPMVSLLTLLPVSVNGMGVREGAMVLLLAPLGVSPGTALTLGFLWFTVLATVSLCGGLVYLFGRFPRPALTPAPSGETDHGSVSRDSDQGREGQHKAVA
jgi:uncharacterized membrane protein YbhN (UPF0104 family)